MVRMNELDEELTAALARIGDCVAAEQESKRLASKLEKAVERLKARREVSI